MRAAMRAGLLVCVGIVGTQAAWSATHPGAVAATFAVSDQGTATYSIPITAPPGTGSLKPNLALTYNHLSGNGLAGIRWSLAGISAITRCAKTYGQDLQNVAVNYSASDRFCLDGQRLVEFSGAYGASGTQYRTEIETFQRVFQSGANVGGGPAQFYVEHGNGLTSYFGYTADSRIEKVGTSSVRIWYISYTEDQHGNRISYTYSENPTTGEAVPSEISWTSRPGLAAKYRIAITYETRPTDDQRSGYDAAGAKWANTKRIDRIDVVYNDTQTISTYDLTYSSPPPTGTGRSQLTSVTQCRGTDCLPPTTFAFQQGTRGWGTFTNMFQAGTDPHVGDVDGDGKQDMYVSLNGTWHVYFGNSSGIFGPPVNTGIGSGPFPIQARVVDILGEGRADLLYRHSGTNWSVLQYQLSDQTFHSNDLGMSAIEAAIVDFNGDGLGDWLFHDGDAIKWRRNLAHEGGWFDQFVSPALASGWGLFAFDPDNVPDFNGDGRGDVVTAAHNHACEDIPGTGLVCTPSWYALVSSGNSYNVIGSFVGGVFNDIINVRSLDVNGDGLDDIAAFGPGEVFVYLSTGTGFEGGAFTGIPYTGQRVFIADYDHDGREDLLLSDGDYWRIHRSNGATLNATYETLYSPGASLESVVTVAADLSGEGFLDLLRNYGGSWHVHAHQTVLPDVVTTFTDGLGYTVAVQYESLANSSHYTSDEAQDPPPYLQPVRRPRPIVTIEDHDDGIGGTRRFSHSYWSAWEEISGRDATSFERHRVDDVARGTHTLTYLERTFPFVGRVAKQELWAGTQLVRRVESTFDSMTWTATTPNRRFPRVELTTLNEYEVGGVANGQHLRTVTDDPEYDGPNFEYGHVRTRTTTVTDPVTAETWTSAVSLDPVEGDGAWCLGRPGFVQTTNTLPDLSSSVRKIRHTWNGCWLAETRDESEASTAKQLKTVFTPDAYGNIDYQTEDSVDGTAQDRFTDFSYDADGQQLTAVTRGSVNLTTSYAWDYLTGQRASVTGTDGLTTSWQYDAFGRVTAESRPDGSTAISYAACSGTCWPQNAVFFARAQGSDGSDDYAYFDELGRSVGRAWTLPGGAQGREESRYNATGNLDRVSRPYLSTDSVYWVTYAYDLIGRRVQQNAPINESTPSGSLTTTEYRGHDVWMTDAEGRTTKYTHNAASQIEQVVDALDGVTTYAYGPFGELTKVTDHDGNETTSGYDGRGLKVSLSDPDMGLWNYAYNAYGERETETDPKTSPNPTRTYAYDEAGRIRTRVEPEGTTTWTYYSSGVGAIGKPDTISGPGNSEHYEYSSSLGAPTLVRRIIDGVTYETNYDYHSAAGGGQGKLSRITYPTNSLGTRLKVDYTYDSFGHPYQVKNGDVPSLIYYTLSAADALGRERTATFGNGVNEVRVYDRANGTLQSIASGPTGTPTSVQNLSYQWDAVGNLTQRRDWIQGKTEDFVYDALSRLRTVQVNSATALSVDYDAIGNISYKSDVGSYAYGAGNAGPHAVTSVSGIQSNTYLYDANGNMTNRDGDTTTWYSFNKPLRMNFGSAYSEMTYGVHRQRIKQVAVGYSGGTLRYVGPEFELLTQGPLRADLHHIFANGSAIARYTTYNFQGPDTRYLHRDSLGSIVATSSGTNSTVLSRYEFEAFGLRWQTAGSGLFTQKGFTGHDHLDAVDLIDMVGRVQDPVLGRFLSADPFVQAPYSSQSLNRYSYVWNNPATLTDASGFQTGCWEDYLPLCDPAGLPPALTLPPWWITYDSGFRNPWDLDLQNAGSMPYSGPAPVTRSSAVGPQDATLTRPRFDRAEYLQYADCSAMPVAAPCGLEMELRRGVRSGEITQAQSDAILRDWYENAAKNAALMVVTSVAAELAVAKLAQWFYAARGTGVAGFHPLRSMNPSGSTTNCVNCALALDATLGGNQAVALAGRAVPLSEVPAIFGAEGFTHQLANASALRSLLQGAGDGARGVVVGLRGAGQPAHAFNAVNQGGVVSFLDAQVGGAASLEGYRQFLFIATAGF